MGAMSPIEKFYDEQLRKLLDQTSKSAAPKVARRGADVTFGLGTTSALSGDVQEALARAKAAEDKAGFFGKVAKAPVSLLKLAGSALSLPGELARAQIFGGTNTLLGLIDKDLVLDVNKDNRIDTGLLGRDRLGAWLSAFDPKESVAGFGDMDPLKVNGDDGLPMKIAKWAGAFAGDTATDPTTYVTAGTGAVGRVGAAKLAGLTIAEASTEQVGKTVATKVAREALEGVGEETVQKLARESLKKTVGTTTDAVANGLDDALDAALKATSKTEATDLAAEELATRAQAAYRRGGNTAFRRELEDNLGKEAGNQLFRQAPAPVRGGIRFAGQDIIGGNSVGGGQVLEKLGKPGEKGIDLLQATTRARNVVGSKIPMGGKASVLNRAAKAAAAAGAKDAGAIALQLPAERMIRNLALSEVEKNTATQALQKVAVEGVQRYDALAKEHGAEAFGKAVFSAHHTVDFEKFAAEKLATPGVSQLERDAIEMARTFRDVPSGIYERNQADLGSVFSEAESLTGTGRYVETSAERARRVQTQEARTGVAKGTRENFKERSSEFWNEAEQRWMTVPEINAKLGRQKFEEDPRKIFLETMDRLKTGVGDAVERRRFVDAGLIVAPPKDLTMSGDRLTKIGKGFQDKATSKAERVTKLAEKTGTVTPTPLQARAMAAASGITEDVLQDKSAEAGMLVELFDEAIRDGEMIRENLPGVRQVEKLIEKRNSVANDVQRLEREIRTESKRLTPEVKKLQEQSRVLSAELADQEAYWAEQGSRKIGKSSQAWLDTTEQDIIDVELAMERATDQIVRMKQEYGRTLAHLETVKADIAEARKVRSQEFETLRRSREKLGRQSEGAQLRLDKATKQKRLGDVATERIARRQVTADAASAAVLERNAPVFATKERIDGLMHKIATQPVSAQDSLYQELATFIMGQTEETIQAMEARVAAMVESGLDDAWTIADRQQYIENSRKTLERMRLTTDPNASVMESFLRDKNFVRAGTQAGSEEVERVAGSLRGYFVDENISRAMTSMYRLQEPTRMGQAFSSVYDPFEKLWRTYATVGRGPGFVTRNVLGGMYNSILAGTGPEGFMLGFKYSSAVMRAERAVNKQLKGGMVPASEIGRFADSILKTELDKLPAVGGRSMWDLHNDMAQRGMFAGVTSAALGTSSADAGAVLGKQKRDVFNGLDREALKGASSMKRGVVRAGDIAANNPWVNTWASWSTHSERYLRSSTFLGSVAKNGGEGPALAYADMLVKATQFDYADLSDFERKVVRFAAPFYVWTKNNVPLQLRSLVNRPGVPAAIFRGQESAEEAFGGTGEQASAAEKFMPDYVQKALGFAGGGNKPLFYGVGAPLADLGKIATGLEDVNSLGDLVKAPLAAVGGFGEESVAQLNPLLKMTVERITGNSLYTGAEYGKEPVTGLLAPFVPGGTVNPETGQLEASAFATAQARNLLPLLGLLQRAVPSKANPILGNPNYDDRLRSSWLSSIAGLGGLPFAAPMGTATDSQIVGQASRQAKDNNAAFKAEAAKQGLDPERLGKMINRGATEEEIQAAIDSGQLLAPYKRIQLGVQ